jgi:hypothetical protein
MMMPVHLMYLVICFTESYLSISSSCMPHRWSSARMVQP